jgi:hypothetical protein
MTLTALYATANAEKKKEYMRVIQENQQKQKKWKEVSAINCAHLHSIVEANLSRIANKYANFISLVPLLLCPLL